MLISVICLIIFKRVLLIIDGQPTRNNQEKANRFNEFFSEASRNGKTEDWEPPELVRHNEELRNINFTALEVRKILEEPR